MGKRAKVGGIGPLPECPQRGGELPVLGWSGWVQVRPGELGKTRIRCPRLNVFVMDSETAMRQLHTKMFEVMRSKVDD